MLRGMITIPLKGPAGEPVDFLRCLLSHGVADLPPHRVDRAARTLTVTLALSRGVRTVVVSDAGGGRARIDVAGRPPSSAQRAELERAVAHLFRLDADLSPFYARIRRDPDLAWAARGAGRLMRCATVFEEVIKTICTTNCAWSATERMVHQLVRHLGRPAPGAARDSVEGRAFPTPAALAAADDAFYRDVVRAGYRGPYIRAVARAVSDGTLDLESFAPGHPAALADDDVEERLLALPGVGPYAAAHILMMLGRHSRLVLDSWTRPAYARLLGRRTVSDAAIRKRFRAYGPYAGLAFWLMLTKEWTEG